MCLLVGNAEAISGWFSEDIEKSENGENGEECAARNARRVLPREPESSWQCQAGVPEKGGIFARLLAPRESRAAARSRAVPCHSRAYDCVWVPLTGLSSTRTHAPSVPHFPVQNSKDRWCAYTMYPQTRHTNTCSLVGMVHARQCGSRGRGPRSHRYPTIPARPRYRKRLGRRKISRSTPTGRSVVYHHGRFRWAAVLPGLNPERSVQRVSIACNTDRVHASRRVPRRVRDDVIDARHSPAECPVKPLEQRSQRRLRRSSRQ